MYSPQQLHAEVIHRLGLALHSHVESKRDRIPDLRVEVATFEEHEHLIPSLVALLSREGRRGTKGMTMDGPNPEGSWEDAIRFDISREAAVVMYRADDDDVIGWGTLAPWEVDEDTRVVEFCAATVDDPYRGMGMGKLLVDARELLAVQHFAPEGYLPLAFCNDASARLYNRDLWDELPWEMYRRYPPPVVCKAECQVSPRYCDCTVLAMALDRLPTLLGI